MKTLTINRQHQLDADACWSLAEDLLQQLVDRYGGSYSQEGECLSYRHTTGMKAMVEPKEGELGINVQLNLMTRSFAPEIERQINKVLDRHIDAE
jgi:putative polyhydroxyalkanoate system protein